jgi:hypothetical protein
MTGGLVGGKNGRKKVVGPLPTLLVGVGPCAEKTLAELSRMTRRLTAPMQGPFGLVLVDSYCEDLFKCDWLWLSDFKIPETSLLRERSEFVGRDDGKLLTALSMLTRRLRSIGPTADPTGSGRLRMSCCVLLDLSDPGVVSSAVRLLEALRKADPALDVTVLGLSGRTAGMDSAYDAKWFEVWKRLLAEFQNEPFAQRIYLLDGCDTDKAWFEQPEQLYRLGAEFLLYHGWTCRHLLRQGERARTALGESLLNVCGSFGCRTIHADLSIAAERIAERVAGEDLADLYARPMPDGWPESVEEQTQALVGKIGGICEKPPPARTVAAGDRHSESETAVPQNTEINEAIARTVKHVCSREPLVSLCHFFRCFQPRLGRLLTHQRLWERTRTRRFAAETLRQQDVATYEPMRTWLSRPETRWADRFTPEQDETTHVAVSRPASRWGYLAGMVFLATGLISIVAGVRMQDRIFVIGGGLLSLAASVLMVLPTGWVRHRRHRIWEGQEVMSSVPAVSYRRRASWWVAGAASLLIAAGFIGFIGPMWPETWTSITGVWAVAVVVIAGVGLASILGGPSQTHVERVSGLEAPRHVDPPAWQCRGMGVLCLALAWVVFCLGLSWPADLTTSLQWLVPALGVVLLTAGVGLALLPLTGRAYFVERIPKLPQPLTGGIRRPAQNDGFGRQLTAMAGWINRLALEPDVHLDRSQVKTVPRECETLFDFLAADWEDQLAQAFRLALEARSGKSLKALALQPVLWTECVTKELQNPHATCPDLASLFALQAVKAWIQSHTLAELLSFLQVDIARFNALAARLASPHWPTPRVEPEVSAGVIAVAKPLWDVLAPLVQTAGGPQIVPLDWDTHSDAIVAVRVVQGLTEGWRGYPGLPGQRQDGPAASTERERAE